MEGSRGSFTVKLDRPVTEDTLVTVRVDEKTAQRSNNAKDDKQVYFSPTGFLANMSTAEREVNIRKTATAYAGVMSEDDPVKSVYQDIGNGGKIEYAQANELNRDFSVSTNGQVQTSNTFQVLVKAGKTESEAFDIDAWRETLSWHQGAANTPTRYEGNEQFCLVVDQVGGQKPSTTGTKPKEVTILDKGQQFGSPVALDLNQDGKIGTTGESTAKDRTAGLLSNASVQFDLDADGASETIEWMNGDGDGLLVDTSQINGRFINGNALFGDMGGRYSNGYEKMAVNDVNSDGKLSGSELDKLGIWIDDGDALLEDGELRSLGEFGITELSTQKHDVWNNWGETLMRSNAMANGQAMMTEDVWFAKK